MSVAAAPAAAAPSAHELLYRIPANDVPGARYFATGIAVDNSSSPSAGDVYVASNNPQVVDKFAPSSSSATYLCQITGTGEASTSPSECDTSAPGVGSFGSVVGIATDPSTGDVYVGDTTDHAIDRFSPTGVYEKRLLDPALSFPPRIAVAGATGLVLLPEEGGKRIGAWNPSTETLTTFSTGADTPAGGFGSVVGIAVDENPSSPNFDSVYVADAKNHLIDRFSEAGTYECQITGAGESTSSGSECSASEPGMPEGSLTEVGPIAVDPTNGHLYADNTSGTPDAGTVKREIEEFDPEGNYLDTIPAPAPWQPFGLAVSKESGYLFVASDNNPNEAYVYSPDRPIAVTANAGGVGSGAAVLQGTVNPLGLAVSDCHFEYVEAAKWEPKGEEPYAGGASVPCEPGPGGIGAGTHPVPVEAHLSGLEAGKVYHYRLVASNVNGTSVSEDEFFGAPYVDAKSASQIGQHTATLKAAINPDNVDTTYSFEYGTTSSYGQSVPASPADVGAGKAEVSVSQAIGSLQLGKTYHYRVVATNAAGTVASPDRTFTTVPALLIDAQPASNIGTTTASLQGYVDPLGSATTYHFEYGPTTAYGSSTEAASAGSGSTAKLAAAEVSGLQAGTSYHFRLVATNANGTIEGPDETFATEPASCPNEARREEQGKAGQMLPECRAFEQVSPEEKGEGPATAPQMATVDGRVFFVGQGSFAGNTWPGASIAGGKYLAQRTEGGWSVEAIQPSEAETGLFNAGLLASTSPDLSQSLWEGSLRSGWFTKAPSGAIYLRPLGGPAVLASPVLQSLDPSVNWEEMGTAFHQVFGESYDFSHVIYLATFPLTPNDDLPIVRGGSPAYRLYDVTTGPSPSIKLVQVNNEDKPIPTCPEAEGVALLGGSEGGGIGNKANNDEFNTVSHDGSTIFFSVVPQGSCGNRASSISPVSANWQIYARVNGTTTVPISEPELKPNCETTGCKAAPPQNNTFVGASEDGSKAFVLSTARLTDEGSEDSNANDESRLCVKPELMHGSNGCSLYMYDFAKPLGRNFSSISAGDASGLGPEVQGVVRSSEDGSHVYFVAQGLLSSEPNSLGQTAKAGADNMYVYDTETEKVSFVDQLCSGEGKSGTLNNVSTCFGKDGSWGLNNEEEFHTYLTPDGNILTFTTYGRLTPDDTNASTDVYRYDATTGALARISIGHHGADANGNGGGGNAEIIPLWSRETQDNAQMMYQQALNSRPITDDGSTIIFSTARPLQEGDENKKVDFYEWHNGQVNLISGGKSQVDLTRVGGTNFFSAGGDPAISPSGKDIVFATDQGLVPTDRDGLPDVYDVRIDGGFAPPPPPPAACESPEACHGGPGAAPASPSTGTDTFAGPGNELQCHRGFKKSHGKCVKAHHKHRKRHHKRRRSKRAGFNRGGAK